MSLALRALGASVSDYWYDIFRMALLNLFWFITALPLLLVSLGLFGLLFQPPRTVSVVELLTLALVGVLVLALAGPGTAALYATTHRLARGELLEPTRFAQEFRRWFRRGWLLAATDVLALALLVLNVWFYFVAPIPGVWLIGIVFGWALVLWMAIQPYLFPLLVEMDQPVRRIWRNAIFIALDNLGLTLGLFAVRAALALMTAGLAPLLLPFVTMTLVALVDNRGTLAVVDQYRAAGRIGPPEQG